MRAAVLLLLLTGCSSSTVESPRGAAGPPEPPTPATPGEPTAEPPAAEAGAAPGRIRYDLAAHPSHAETREGGVLVIDHGTAGGAKYTLGGWQTSVEDRDLDGTSVALVAGTRGKLLVPFDRDGDTEVVLRARLFRPGPLHVYLGTEHLAEVGLPADGRFGIARVRIPAAHARRGEATLLLRTTRTGDVPGGGRAGVAVDWVRVGPAGAPIAETPPVTAETSTESVGGHPSVRLPEGLSVGWAFEVPEGARLRGVVAGAAGARLEVTAHVDGDEPRVLGRVPAGDEPARLDLPLTGIAGRVARIDLAAAGGEVRVVRPAVVTLDAREAPRFERPENVLVYLIDTLRADKLRPYHSETRVRTPGLDRFLEGATTLASAHTQENWTKPSVATLLSSLMPWEHTAVRGESVVPASVELLPEVLKEHGFYTGSFIANGYVSDRFGFRQGWDTYRNYIREGRRTPAQYVAADVLGWLEERPADQPFLLYVHTIDPHVPYRPPDEFVEMYQEEPYRGPLSFRRDATLLENIKLGRIRVGPADKAHLEALYDGEITYHDVHFAAILDGLARRGLDGNTMVVVTSDHGEEFWDHGSVGHGHNVYEELLHVPMFVRLPGVTDGLRRLDAPVGLVDVMPTILDALGREIPDDLAGRSFLPLLLGRDEPAPRHAVSGFMDGWRTIVVGRTKLIQRSADHVMLHDLVEDPGELTDVAADRPIAVRYARGLLGLALAEADEPVTRARPRRRPARHRSEEAQIDADTEAQLRALGYVDGWR